MLMGAGGARTALSRLNVGRMPRNTDFLDGDPRLPKEYGINRAIKDTEEASLAIIEMGDISLAICFVLRNYVGGTGIYAYPAGNAYYGLDI